MTSVHEVAARGFARAAAAYADGRPGYPAEISGWLGSALGIGAGSVVAEVGAGTGLFTRSLVDTGARVVAIDPVAEMLAVLHRRLPTVETMIAPADTLPLPDGSVDAIVCATAFHWFATSATLAEFHRILRPGGALGLVWNVRDERVPWVAELSVITDAYSGDAVRQRDQSWRDPFPHPGFSPLAETGMRYDHCGGVDDVVVGRTLSTSFIGALDDDAKARVLAQVRELIARTPALQAAEVCFPYLTKAYHCRRID